MLGARVATREQAKGGGVGGGVKQMKERERELKKWFDDLRQRGSRSGGEMDGGAGVELQRQSEDD